MTDKKRVKTKIRCAVSGIVTGVRPDVYDKRVAKAGGDEDFMLNTYVCSQGKRLLREGKTVAEIRESVDVDVLALLPDEAFLESNGVIAAVMEKKAKKATGVKRGRKAKKAKEEVDADIMDADLDPDVQEFLKEGQEVDEVED